MKTHAKTVFPVVAVFVTAIMLSVPPAFAEVTIIPADGSGAPGCEETAEGCYIPEAVTVSVGETVIMSNTDTAAHTYTSGTPDGGPDGNFDTSLIMTDRQR